MLRNNSKYYLQTTITSTQGVGSTFKISPDFETSTNLETGTSTVPIVLKNATQIERMEISATGGIATIVKRGILPDETGNSGTTFQKQWYDGTILYISQLASDMIDKGGDTMTGSLSFTGIHAGIKPISLTTAQRTSLSLSSLDTAIVYDNTIGQYYSWNGGSWNAMASGTNPNASETVAGKVEIATQAQVDAGTLTGETGALLVVTPDKYISNRNAYYTANIATTAETTTGNIDTKIITPLKLQQKIDGLNLSQYGNATFFIASNNIKSSSPAEISLNFTSLSAYGTIYSGSIKNANIGSEGIQGVVSIKGKLRITYSTTANAILRVFCDTVTSYGTYRVGSYDTVGVADSGYISFSGNANIKAGEQIQIKLGVYCITQYGYNSGTPTYGYLKDVDICFDTSVTNTSFI